MFMFNEGRIPEISKQFCLCNFVQIFDFYGLYVRVHLSQTKRENIEKERLRSQYRKQEIDEDREQ